MKTFRLIFILFLSNSIFSQSTKTADFHKDKAIDELMRGNKQIALIEIDESIKLDSNNADSFYLRGYIYQELKDLNKALTNYNTALKV